MSSSARINENGHLDAVPNLHHTDEALTPPHGPDDNTDDRPYPYEVLHQLIDLVLEGDTETALRNSQFLTPDELRFYSEKLETLRAMLTARTAVHFMRRMPDVNAMLRDLGLIEQPVQPAELKGAGE